jgi:hypothetical protein
MMFRILLFGGRGIGQGMQPFLDFDGADICQPFRAPFGDNLVCQIERHRRDGGKRLPVLGQFVIAIVGDELGDRYRHPNLDVDVGAKLGPARFCASVSRDFLVESGSCSSPCMT